MSHPFVDEFNAIAEDVHNTAKSKGFWWEGVNRNKAEMIALMHSELSECLEAVRKEGTADEHVPGFLSEEIELADTIIRIMDYARGWALRVPEAVLAKLEFNKTRPYKHAKKF